MKRRTQLLAQPPPREAALPGKDSGAANPKRVKFAQEQLEATQDFESTFNEQMQLEKQVYLA